MAKWCGFTICFDPSLPWLEENLKNIREEFDHFFIIYGWDGTMRNALEAKIGPEKVQASFVDAYCKFRTRLQFREDLVWIDANYGADKLEMCNEAYRTAGNLACDYIWQIDSDEFYTAESIREIKKEVEKRDLDIASVREVKYWKNFMPLNGGIWNSTPARIFKVKLGFSFTNHRPPTIGMYGRRIEPSGSTVAARMLSRWELIEENKLNPSNAPTIDIPGHHMHHFCYVDQCQVMLKSVFFSLLRKDHPTYSQYEQWFLKWFVPWGPDSAFLPWQYHPSSEQTLMAQREDYDPVKFFEQIELMFPKNKSFLRRYVISFSVNKRR